MGFREQLQELTARTSTLLPLLLSACVGCGAGAMRDQPQAPSVQTKPHPVTQPVVQLNKHGESAPTEKRIPEVQHLLSSPTFHDVSRDVQIEFTYLNGEDGRALMVESIGGGAGWLDFDRDGLFDLYLNQGGDPAPPGNATQPNDELFRQVKPSRFHAVTQFAAVKEQNYSNGIAIADFDDDGFEDIFITNVGPDTLLKNLGDGTFVDATSFAGVGDPRWGSCAAWGDLDSDGDLDLYVCNYLDYDPRHPLPCRKADGSPAICHPRDAQPSPDEAYFNQGDGTFTPEAKQRGLFGDGNKALGVVIADLNNDGLCDIYVANDTTANFLFINQGRGQFIESAILMGCAVSREGLAQASMGIGLGDFDHNGWLDLYCTHFTYESNTLYKNLGPTGFQDVTGLAGLHSPTLAKLAFGTIMADFNQDGREDIFIANGHIDDWKYKGEDREMQAQLFSFAGPRFVECGNQGGDYFTKRLIGRGVAQCDFDDDGDWDLAVVHQNSPVAILRNDSVRGHWLKLQFVAEGNRFGLGTRVTLRQDDKLYLQEMAGGTSYSASQQHALIFGLGTSTSSCELVITWPNGKQTSLNDVNVDQSLMVRQE